MIREVLTDIRIYDDAKDLLWAGEGTGTAYIDAPQYKMIRICWGCDDEMLLRVKNGMAYSFERRISKMARRKGDASIVRTRAIPKRNTHMKIELKKPTIDDKDGLMAVCNAVDRTYLSDRMPYPYTDEDAEWWINMVAENDGKTGIWRLIYVDGKPVGSISVELKPDVYHRDGEIGYFLITDYWSKGIMTEAAREICRIAFEKLDIIRITGLYYAPNTASGRVLEKVGFEYEGTRKSGVSKGDNIYDLCMTGLLKEKFEL